MRRSSLTGSWSGAYRYPRGLGPETVFNLQIDESSGAFIGQTQEPNFFFAEAGPILTADIEGARAGQSLTFTKTYHLAEIGDPVRYEAEADAELTRVDGVWTIMGSWSGTFFMTRDDDGAAAKAEESAEADLELRK